MNTLKRNFTLVEMLVVIAIIGILAGILLPVLSSARTRAKETQCINNLKQLITASIGYRQDYGGKRLPGWLSGLYNDRLKNKDIYLCPMDGNPKDTAAADWKARADDHWQNIYDRPGNTGMTYVPNPEVGKVSYFYEFSDAPCSFANVIGTADNKATWCQVKTYQMTTNTTEHPGGKFPVIRCFWHIKNWEDYDADLPNSTINGGHPNGIPNAAEKVFNAGINGNVFYSTAQWELRYWTP